MINKKELFYDILYFSADKLFKFYNPCEISDGKCYSGKNGHINFCCNGCEHLSKDGCTVKPLACKLWLCRFTLSQKNFPKFFVWVRDTIYYIAKENNLFKIRASKEQTLNASMFNTGRAWDSNRKFKILKFLFQKYKLFRIRRKI